MLYLLLITYMHVRMLTAIGTLIKNNHWIVVLLPFHATVKFPMGYKTRSVDPLPSP